jgi:nitroimidazol reductase NimA-like FMN-containing flavoprotein (pyridoxamine 5'-phosphate oxidase superfamily)
MPSTQVDQRYSTPDAAATPWGEARARLEGAEVYWLTTVRPGGRPHVTPLIAVWVDEALWFCTGPEERKARNLAANTGCVLTTG